MIGQNYGAKLEKDEETILSENEEREKAIIKHILKEKHLKHRKFVEDMKKKEEELKIQQENIPTNSAYINRRYHSANIKAKVQNERMKNLLNKVDVYLNKIEKVDKIELLKIEAAKELENEKKRKVSKDKMVEILGRLTKLNKKDETEKEKTIAKIKQREKSKSKIVKTRPSSKQKIIDKEESKNKSFLKNNVNNLFKLDESITGTNAIPEPSFPDNQNPEKVEKINNFSNEVNFLKRIKSAYKLTNKNTQFNSNSLPFINEKNIAEIELRKILKTGNNIESLQLFKKKYKWFDVTPYIHKAHIENIINKSLIKRGKSFYKQENMERITKEAEFKLKGESNTSNSVKNYDNNINDNNNDKINDGSLPLYNNKTSDLYNSYLNSCIYNSSDYIQLHLLSSRGDDEILDKINEKDEYNRKGIFYLILHRNFAMIKLTILSGLIISDTIDIYKRNLIHYCAILECYELLEVICRCLTFEYKEDYEGMKNYLMKIIENKRIEESLAEENLDQDIKQEILKKMENNLINQINSCDIDKMSSDQIHSNLVIKIKRNYSESEFNPVNPTIITSNKNYFYEEIKRSKIPLSNYINQVDMDGKTPLHYAAENNNLQIIKLLVYYNSKIDKIDFQNKRPLDYATSEVVIKYLIGQSRILKRNSNDKKELFEYKTSISKNKDNFYRVQEKDILDLKNLKYLSDDEINKITTGYENNSLLILSIIRDNFGTFCYLLKNKNADIKFRNFNGWNALHFIIANRRYKYLSYIFLTDFNNNISADPINNEIKDLENLSEIRNNSDNSSNLTEIEKLYNMIVTKEFTHNEIYNSQGILNTVGSSFVALDCLTNNQINPLFLTLLVKNLKESFYLFKILTLLLIKRENLQLSGALSKEKISQFEIIINRKYDKTEYTLLLKAIEHKNHEVMNYLLTKVHEDYYYVTSNSSIRVDKEKRSFQVNLYDSDKLGLNALHYAVKFTKDPKFIKYLIKLDSDKNILKSVKDCYNKTPRDYDNTKNLTRYFTHLWDACESNDHILLLKMISDEPELNLNEQSPLNRNSPLHIAAMNCADKACLFLIKNNADCQLINAKKQTALEIAVDLERLSEGPKEKLFLKKIKAIIKGDITEYVQLDNFNNYINNKSLLANSFAFNSSLASAKNSAVYKIISEILNKIRTQMRERNLNIQKIFDLVDENKNGKIEGHEFESLFTILDIKGVNRNDLLLMMSYIDTNKNGLIEYNEFVKVLEGD